jgi:DNA-directed RNA polymerase subunit E"
MRACKTCKRITEAEQCPVCKINTSQYWSGYLCVVDPDKSEIAKRLGIKLPGHYAMKVR